jgi:hypothetical protein
MSLKVSLIFLVASLFVTGLSQALTRPIQTTVVNRSMRDVDVKIYNGFDLCEGTKLLPKEKHKVQLGSKDNKICENAIQYRLKMTAKKDDGVILHDDCIVYPELSNRDLLILWDGVKCFVKDNTMGF